MSDAAVAGRHEHGSIIVLAYDETPPALGFCWCAWLRVTGSFRVSDDRIVHSHGRKVNLSHVFAGQSVGVTQVGERIWLVTFMQ